MTRTRAKTGLDRKSNPKIRAGGKGGASPPPQALSGRANHTRKFSGFRSSSRERHAKSFAGCIFSGWMKERSADGPLGREQFARWTMICCSATENFLPNKFITRGEDLRKWARETCEEPKFRARGGARKSQGPRPVLVLILFFWAPRRKMATLNGLPRSGAGSGFSRSGFRANSNSPKPPPDRTRLGAKVLVGGKQVWMLVRGRRKEDGVA